MRCGACTGSMVRSQRQKLNLSFSLHLEQSQLSLKFDDAFLNVYLKVSPQSSHKTSYESLG